MTRLLSLCCLCLLLSRTASAASIVTWQAEGDISFSSYLGMQGTPFLPPAGTPYQLTLTFDRSAVTTTPLSPAGSNCFMVPVTGSLTVGGIAHGLDGLGFTHAQLPANNCTPGAPETQFFLGIGAPSTPSPWIFSDGFMELWFTDLLIKDAFPDSPTDIFGGFQIRDQFNDFIVTAAVDLEAVNQTAVPEPGTLTLFGLGLAAVARTARRRIVAHD